MNKLVKIALATILPFLLSTSFAENYEINAAFGLTGDSIIHGQTDLNATKLAIQDFEAENPGSKVSLKVEDTGSSDKGAITAVQRLASMNKSQIILGPTWLDTFQAPIFLAKQKKLFLLSPSAASAAYKKAKGDYPYIFATWIPLEQGIDTFYRLLINDKRKTMIMISDQDPYIAKVRELLIARKPPEITILENIEVPSGMDSFIPILTRIANKEADVLFLNVGSTKSFLTLFQQRKQLKITTPIYAQEFIESLYSTPEFKDLLEGVTYYFPETSDEALIKRYKETYQSSPEVNLGFSYDAAYLLLNALKLNFNTPEKLFTYLTTREFPSKAYGKVRFNEEGDIESKVRFTKRSIKNGKVSVEGAL